MNVIRRIGSVLGAGVLALALAGPAHAEVAGVVKAVDPVTGVVYFTDGRIVHLDQSAEIYADGAKVVLRDLRPGTRVEIKSAAASPSSGAQVAQPGTQSSRPVVLSAHPPVDAIGTIASVDRQAGTVTLSDGRTLKVTDRTIVWQRSQPQTLWPGSQVYIDEAQPIAFVEPGKPAMNTQDGSTRMGTVSSVDPQRRIIVLTDGSTVRMSPTAVVRFNGQPVAVTELTPGSEIIVRVKPAAEPQPAASPQTMDDVPREPQRPVTDLSRGDYTSFDAADVVIVRKHQAP
jgi:hypothetical protein